MVKEIAFEMSFASHARAVYWSDKNKLKPEEVALNSHKKFWFNCDKCNHEFETKPNAINANNSWCPYCYNRKLCDNDNCEKCFNLSFASHHRAQNWSSNNTCKPRDVIKGSEQKYYFDCNLCKHNDLHISPKKITTRNQFCKYCGHKDLCDNDDCEYCFVNSFASVERCKYLLDKSLNPRNLFKSSSKSYDFVCDRCNHIFNKFLSDVTRGIWCPYCYNKTEEIIYQYLKNNYSIKRQYKPIWCKNEATNKYLPFDFYLTDCNIIIELDGPQHFKQVGKWQSHLTTQDSDKYKLKCANNNGVSMIRLLQKDVWHNRYDWQTELIENIAKIITENVVQNIFMCKNDEYSYVKND